MKELLLESNNIYAELGETDTLLAEMTLRIEEI